MTLPDAIRSRSKSIYDRAWQIGVLIGFGAGVLQILAGGPRRGRDAETGPRLATT
jgi:hypothetical protein